MSTSIEWTRGDDGSPGSTWNPVRGCSMAKGSELGGCLNCYAARQSARNLPGHRSPTTGNAFAILTDNGPRWTGKVELIESKLLEPLHWKKPRRVFVNSMSDLFHENLPDESIDRIFAVMALTPHITYQVLTKRARRMLEYCSGSNRRQQITAVMNSMPGFAFTLYQPYPLENLWLGVSVENQPTADERIPELLRTPAALRFVSYEPALADIDWLDMCGDESLNALTGWRCGRYGTKVQIPQELRGLDWGIIGGESGPGARPFRLDWARNTILQFKATGVPLFVKQVGSRPTSSDSADLPYLTQITGKGGDPEQWPADLRVREFPQSRS